MADQTGENLQGESQASSLPGALTGSDTGNNQAGAQQQPAKTKRASSGRQTSANSRAGATRKQAALAKKDKDSGRSSHAGVITGPGKIARGALEFIGQMRASNRRMNTEDMRNATSREFNEILNGIYPR